MISDTTNDVMTTTNDTARSGKTQTLDEVLVQLGYSEPEAQTATQDQHLVMLLECVQRITMPDCYGFMYESWDWLVALQWMQDKGMFKTNPQRPPFAAFSQWLHKQDVPQLHTQCTTHSLRHANKMIAGARYPWTDVHWEPNVIRRWHAMYRLMNSIWKTLSRHNDMSRNEVSEHE